MILSARSSAANAADVTFMKAHLDDLARCREKIAFVVADKGYDSTEVHRDIASRIRCEARIPVRTGKKGFTVHGFERRTMLDLSKDKEGWKMVYGKRSIIESTDSMVKNLTGTHILEQIDVTREKRALLKAFAFNIWNALRIRREWVFK